MPASISFISIRRLIRMPITTSFRETSGEVSQAQFHAFTDTWSWADAAETYHQFIDQCPNVAVVEMMEAFHSFLKNSVLQIKAKFYDAGYLSNLTPPQIAIFDALLLAVERLKELISKVESK